MSGASPLDPNASSGSELEQLRHSWIWLLIFGIALILLGMFAISSSFIATLATILVFGYLLLIGAALQVINAFWAHRWRGFFLHLLVGILYLITGLIMIDKPLRAAEAVTLLVAAFLLVGGLFRIVVSLTERFPHWGWMLLNGVISLFLGIAIWREWPYSGLWVIGLFVGIEMIFSGWTWVMLGLGVRSIVSPKSP